MRVMSMNSQFDSAMCKAADGEVQEVMTGLILNVTEGEILLVHAGTAIARVSSMSDVQSPTA